MELSKVIYYIQFFVNYYKILTPKAQNIVALTFQSYAESEKQNKPFHIWKQKSLLKAFVMMQQWGGAEGCTRWQVRAKFFRFIFQCSTRSLEQIQPAHTTTSGLGSCF